MSQQYVTVEEAAACLKVSERAIRRYIAAGKLAAGLTRGPSGKEWRIRADSLTNFQTAAASPNGGSGHPPDRPGDLRTPADTCGHPPADTSGHPPDRPGDLRTPLDTCGHPPADTSGHPVSEPPDTDTASEPLSEPPRSDTTLSEPLSEPRPPAPWTSPPYLDRKGLTLEEFLARLDRVHYSGGQYEAMCPAHKDRKPSLSITEGEDGRILLHCFAGCPPEAIVAALKLTMADLFPTPASRPEPAPPRRIVATYDYRDEAGQLLYQTVRYDPKDFRQRRPDGAGGWLWNLDGVQRVLYRLPELCQAAPTDWVFVCEGEKDADRLVALGLTATTNPLGAGKWREEYAEPLRGRRVGLLPDHDAPGRKHAAQVAASLTRHGAAAVKVLNLPNLPDKGDVSDWVAAGHTAEELLSLAESAERWEPLEKPSRPATTGPLTPPESEGPKPVRKGLEEVLATFRKWLYLPDAGALEVLLGAVAANYGRGDPVWLLLVGPPGGGKTEVLNSLGGLADVHSVAVLTEASLLSGTPQRDREKGTQGGLLYEVGRFGVLLVKDFGGVLSLQKDARGPVLAALREIYDGSWTRYVGTGGGKSLSWSGKCGLVGGATPSIDQHYAVMSSLGERFAFYRLPPAPEPERAQRALQLAGQEDQMRPELAAAVTGLWAGLPPPRGIPALSPEEEARLVALAVFTTRCRSSVERDPYGNREVVLIPGAESPTRLVKMLALLLGGLDSLGCSRKRAWELVHKVAWDSMPGLRRQVLDTLRKAATLTTTQVAATLGYPTNTTRRTLEDLACYEVVIRQSGGPGKADLWLMSDWTQATLNAARLPEGKEEDLGAYCSDGLEK